MPALDTFANQTPGVSGPFLSAASVAPHDSNELTHVTRALWVGTAGNLALVTQDGSAITFANFGPAWLPGRIRAVKATGTTATDLVAVW